MSTSPRATDSIIKLQADAPLLDKYVLPKVAFAAISLASLMGTVFTLNTLEKISWIFIFWRWIHLLGLAFLTGGLMWQVFFVRPSTAGDQSPRALLFTHNQFRRFARAEVILLIEIAVTGWILAATYENLASGMVKPGVYTSLLPAYQSALVLLLVVGILKARAGLRIVQPLAEAGERKVSILAVPLFGIGIILLGLNGGLNVLLRQDWNNLALIVRGIHLAAFALWYGGAAWNIFIAVPSARETACYEVVLAAGRQLEFFRRVVRFIFLGIIGSGLWQAYRYFSFHLEVLPETFFGQLILIKIGLIAALVAIFITCPMWRACSPIAGVCNLEDLVPENEMEA